MHGPLDPEHLNPTPEPEPGPIPWVSTAPGPAIPEAALGGDVELPSPWGIGPTYEPEPGRTVGVLPGVSLEEAQRIRGAAHGQDDGSYAANEWTHVYDRDGTPHLDVTEQTPGMGTSPSTVAVRNVTGVESPLDPGARRGRVMRRWMDRRIDMHRYEPQFPPKTVRNVTTAQVQPAPANHTQRDSPFATVVSSLAGMAPPDRWVEPQLRRTPRDWQETATTDGTVPGGVFGLGSWGA
jgi:hypothetical protein